MAIASIDIIKKTEEKTTTNHPPTVAVMSMTGNPKFMPKTEDVERLISLENLYARLNATPQQITEFCQKWQICEFALFGSILRDDFRLHGDSPSDVDVLFTYGQNARRNLILQVRMQHELEALFHRNVDLVSKTAIISSPNDIRRQNILNSAIVIYDQG